MCVRNVGGGGAERRMYMCAEGGRGRVCGGDICWFLLGGEDNGIEEEVVKEERKYYV